MAFDLVYVALLAVFAELVGCAKADPSKPSTSASGPSAQPLASSVVASRFDCATDDDCVTSCSRGAVSKSWYLASSAKEEKCEDGCASKGIVARCVASKCAAFDPHGERVAECTQKP
jgi:hypothetical protein